MAEEKNAGNEVKKHMPKAVEAVPAAEKVETMEGNLINAAEAAAGAVKPIVTETEVVSPGSGEAKGREGKGKFGRRPVYDDEEKEVWVPRTAIGKKVYEGTITNLDDLLRAGMPILEAGVVDKLLPGLNEEVIHVRRVQRTIDSGRRMKFSILAAVGDKNGHVGVGMAKGVEAGPTIKKAINRAKISIVMVPRGCSSWECGCGEPHTVPYEVTGKMGSVNITLKPAPRGVGLVVGDNSKKVLDFAGIKDVWSFSNGHRRTVVNQAFAIYDALKQLSAVKSEAMKKKQKHE